jgi:hypothetical protein
MILQNAKNTIGHFVCVPSHNTNLELHLVSWLEFVASSKMIQTQVIIAVALTLASHSQL